MFALVGNETSLAWVSSGNKHFVSSGNCCYVPPARRNKPHTVVASSHGSRTAHLSETDSKSSQYVASGMPPLEHDGRTTSFFEFWPMWVMYLPVVLQWLFLSIRYRSLTLPLLANPAIPLSGMVGIKKSAIFDVAGDQARQWILPWVNYRVSGQQLPQQCEQVLQLLASHELTLPIVAKPNIGCRGAGVKLLQDQEQLLGYLGDFPAGGEIQFQRLAEWEAEAGVFYVRHPDARQGQITSLTLKYTPFVVGNGKHTLAQLVAADPRAGELLHLYEERHASQWQDIVPAGQPYRLVFSASHCRGAVFRDASEHTTAALTATLDAIFDDIPGFHYGRLDIKFRDLDSLKAGQNLAIIEINGASAESINIWDRKTGLGQAVATLLQQYRTLFTLGDANRRRGHRAPGIAALWRAWRYENNLIKQYPLND